MAQKLFIHYFLKLTLLALIVYFILNINTVNAARRHRTKLPLIDDTIRQRQLKANNVCQFGNQTYSINEHWRPNLGPPIGTLYCVHCECQGVTKKHRKEPVARVRCKNIKDECPKTNCDNPILLPETCCKTCPDEKDDNISIKDLKNNQNNDYSKNEKNDAFNNEKLFTKEKVKTNKQGSIDSIANGDETISKYDIGAISSKDVDTIKTRINNNKENLNPMTTYLSDDANDFASSDNNLLRKCTYEKQVYDEAAQWKSAFNDCEMCYCQKGKIKCEPIICPTLNCTKTRSIKGQCCSICADAIKNESTSSVGNNNNNVNETLSSCEFAGRKRFPGSKWHPYLPPFGFDRCTVCTCMEETMKVKCSRSECPPLACPEHEAYRENDMDCCKRCPNVIVKVESKDQLGDQRSVMTTWKKTSSELLAEGGCKQKGRVFANGDDWHPHIHPIGEYKCVKCNCKDRHINCKRLECPALDCPVKVFGANECCPRCGDSNDKSLLISSKKTNRRRKNRRKDYIHHY